MWLLYSNLGISLGQEIIQVHNNAVKKIIRMDIVVLLSILHFECCWYFSHEFESEMKTGFLFCISNFVFESEMNLLLGFYLLCL